MGSQTIRAAMECHRACNNKKLQDEISLADRFPEQRKGHYKGPIKMHLVEFLSYVNNNVFSMTKRILYTLYNTDFGYKGAFD